MFLNCGDSFTDVSMCQNWLRSIFLIWAVYFDLITPHTVRREKEPEQEATQDCG